MPFNLPLWGRGTTKWWMRLRSLDQNYRGKTCYVRTSPTVCDGPPSPKGSVERAIPHWRSLLPLLLTLVERGFHPVGISSTHVDFIRLVGFHWRSLLPLLLTLVERGFHPVGISSTHVDFIRLVGFHWRSLSPPNIVCFKGLS